MRMYEGASQDASAPPRYSSRPLPACRFVPGETARPIPDPEDRVSQERQAPPPGWRPEEWHDLPEWLWALDLFNHGYWWESHEALEGLWHAAGRTTPSARFVQSLIHLSAACLNHRRGHAAAARRQAARAVRGLRAARAMGSVVMGIQLVPLAKDVVRAFAGRESSPIGLRIALAEASP